MTFAPLLAILLASAVQDEKPLITEDELQEMVRQAIPTVERATGVKFREPVWVRVSTREEVEWALTEELIPQMKVLLPEAAGDPSRKSAGKLASVLGEILIAKYAWKSGTVHVVPATLQRIAKTLEQPDLLDRGMLRVIVTHELVHAIDHQEHAVFRRAAAAKTVTELEILNVLSEGHAQHVTRRVFEAAGELAFFDAYEKIILAGPPNLGKAEKYLASVMTSSVKLAYVEGRAFFDALEKTGRKTYVQDAFRNPPASKNVILQPERFYAPGEAAGASFDPAPAFEAFGREFGPEWTRRTQEIDTSMLRTAFGDFVDARDVDDALKGVVQGHVIVLTPKQAPQSKLVVVSILRGADAGAVKKIYDLSLRMAKEKDKRFADGEIRITKAEYTSLSLPSLTAHTLMRKTLSIRGEKATVASVLGTMGPFEFEVLLSNEEGDDARLKAMVERLAEALGKK